MHEGEYYNFLDTGHNKITILMNSCSLLCYVTHVIRKCAHSDTSGMTVSFLRSNHQNRHDTQN